MVAWAPVRVVDKVQDLKRHGLRLDRVVFVNNTIYLDHLIIMPEAVAVERKRQAVLVLLDKVAKVAALVELYGKLHLVDILGKVLRCIMETLVKMAHITKPQLEHKELRSIPQLGQLVVMPLTTLVVEAVVLVSLLPMLVLVVLVSYL